MYSFGSGVHAQYSIVGEFDFGEGLEAGEILDLQHSLITFNQHTSVLRLWLEPDCLCGYNFVHLLSLVHFFHSYTLPNGYDKMAPKLEYAFTLHVDLAPPQDFGTTFCGQRRFIPITGGRFEGPRIKGTILAGGGDWNAARPDGVVHLLAKYTIQADDGTLISVTNEVYGRANQDTMRTVFGDNPAAASMEGVDGGANWYTKTFPRFEVAQGEHDWLTKSCFIGDLLPPQVRNHVKIDVYEVL